MKIKRNGFLYKLLRAMSYSQLPDDKPSPDKPCPNAGSCDHWSDACRS